MTQPFDELDPRGPWYLSRQAAVRAATVAALLGVALFIAAHGFLVTVMVLCAVAALVSSARWTHESLPEARRQQLRELAGRIEAWGRPRLDAGLEQAGCLVAQGGRRAADALAQVRSGADALVERYVPPETQQLTAHAAMALASLMAVVAVMSAGLSPTPRATLTASRSQPARAAAAPAAVTTSTPPTTAAPKRTGVWAAAKAPAAPVVAASVPQVQGPLPVGKGMWIWMPDRAEGGDVKAIVARAKSVGLTHLYVRVGSSVDGFVNQGFLNGLLPAAHAAGLRVYGWDFPYFDSWQDDVNRMLAAANYTTPGGQRLDGLSADVELQSMGVRISHDTVMSYGSELRKALGPQYPLIATVPRPSSQLTNYPFAELATYFDALAPMVYWLNREPGSDVAGALQTLAAYGKPIFPIGQAYDGSGEGGRPGVPPRAELQRFMEVADQFGATSVSFWSWQHADQQAWDAIRDASQFTLPASPQPMTAGQVHAYQVLLNSLGFPVKVTNQLDEQTATVVATYQQRAHLPVTGAIDAATRAMLLTPFAPPIHPAH